MIGVQPDEAREVLVRAAERLRCPMAVANQDWQAFEQHGPLVFQVGGLLDLPLPQLRGRHEIDNAGNAIAALRLLGDGRITDTHIAEGLKTATWSYHMQRLGQDQGR